MLHHRADVKIWLVRLVCLSVRWYFRWPTPSVGKSLIWRRVLRPYVLWRHLTLTAVTRFGAVLVGELPDVIHSYLYFFGVWEPGVTSLYRSHLRPGDVCIDIGANVGAHALLAAHLVGPAGRVHAIEASPSIYQRLLRNLEANRYRHIAAYNVAVTDKAGPVEIFLHDPENLGGTTIMAEISRQRPAAREAVVAGYPLPQILPVEEIRRAKLIKIDVEGAEWLVVRGMTDLLPSLREDCLIIIEAAAEPQAENAGTIGDLIDVFRANGLEAFGIINTYSPQFYFQRLKRSLTSTISRDAALLDLGFARAVVRDRLLAADVNGR